MKFSNIDKGTYVAVKFTDETLNKIQEVQDSLRLLNPVKREDLHSTIAYSRVNVPFIPNESGNFISSNQHLEIWNTNDGPALIMVLDDANHLKERHNLANILGATYDFPDYTPHITLSYNLGPQEVELSEFSLPIESAYEYMEDLDIDWAKDKK